jgi:hypothetical protein
MRVISGSPMNYSQMKDERLMAFMKPSDSKSFWMATAATASLARVSAPTRKSFAKKWNVGGLYSRPSIG